MGPVRLTCTPCSEPLPAAQRALTTTGAYVETTFPFKISAGAMTLPSPLPTMDAAEIKAGLPLLPRTAGPRG